jgi:hypothetical protein
MSEGKHVGTFQGIPVQAARIERKPGLSPDFGTLEFFLEHLKGADVEADFRLWGAAGFKESAGPFTMHVLASARGPGKTTTSDATPNGIKRGGALTLKTRLNNQQTSDSKVTLTPLFLTSSAIEEMQEDIDENVPHTKGRVRMTVTDIRYWWREFGTPVYGRYNMVLDNAQIDAATVDPSTGEPWSILKVIDYLCVCLPGQPRVTFSKRILASDPNPPMNLDMKMELPAVWLERLLLAYGWELHLSNNSNVYIARRGDEHTLDSFPSTPGGSPRGLGVEKNYRKKTQYILERPEAAVVVGGQRERRVRMAYEPAFIDEDNEVRRMADLPALWGYSVEQARASACLKSEKAYADIPARDIIQKNARTKIAQKDFFKLYAPSALFGNQGLFGSGPVSSGTTRDYWRFEKRKHPFFPAQDAWWTPNELAAMGVSNKTPASAVLVKTGAIIRANLIRQRYYPSADDVQSQYEAWRQRQNEAKNALLQQLSQKRQEAAAISASEPDWESMSQFDKTKATLSRGQDRLLELIDRDVAYMNRQQEKGLAEKKQIQQRIAKEAAAIGKQIDEINESLDENAVKVSAIVNSVAKYGFARLWVNVPWGIVEEGEAEFDPETGLVMFQDIVGIMEAPSTYDRESINLIADGIVEVTFGTKVFRHHPADWSIWTFRAVDGEKPALVRISEASNLRPYRIEDENLVVHENEAGVALNADEAAERAADLAASVLGSTTKQDGYAYSYPGFWNVSTSDDINSVGWEWDGDVAHTLIQANFPEHFSFSTSLARKREREKLIYGG